MMCGAGAPALPNSLTKSEDGVSATSFWPFNWSPTGYTLVERSGDPPHPGAEVEQRERRFRVTKIAPSPLPGDRRPCAYLLPA